MDVPGVSLRMFREHHVDVPGVSLSVITVHNSLKMMENVQETPQGHDRWVFHVDVSILQWVWQVSVSCGCVN